MNAPPTNRLALAAVCIVTASIISLLLTFGWDAVTMSKRNSIDLLTYNESDEPLVPVLETPTPRLEEHDGYVSSSSCRECHASEHESWHHSFHRTMTQFPTSENVVASFENVQFEKDGHVWQLSRDGKKYMVDMIDPIWERTKRSRGENPYTTNEVPPRLKTEVVMLTGSHHRQSYWVSSENPKRGNELHQFPWTYQISEQKWIPLDDAFLQSPKSVVKYSCWSDNCINCHSVGGKPGLDPEFDFVETTVAELGISCEACHGPGEKHVAYHRSLKEQDAAAILKTSTAVRSSSPKNLAPTPNDARMLNPSDCSHTVSSQVCGSCHSFSHTHNARQWWTEGRIYRPGQDLEAVRNVLHYDKLTAESPMRDGYWDDGTVRTGGREYNGISISACYTQGKLGCISCHSMHDSEPNHQLAPNMTTNAACTSCHPQIAADVSAHTHHAADSSGSLCYNCHMPHTSYALLSVLRSHRIDSPSVKNEVKSGRPNACNLCHLDKTLAWTDNHLANWYQAEKATLSDEQKQVAASLLLLYKGDAAQRVVAAGNYGIDAARQTSGETWMVPALATLLNDPYSAVRWVAFQSLQKIEPFNDFEFDFIGSEDYRRQKSLEVLQIWRKSQPHVTQAELLFNADATIDEPQVQRLLSERDDRQMQVTE